MTSAPPRSILVLYGRYHIMSNASIVNNCIIFTFSKQAFKESIDFATVHSLMDAIDLIDNCRPAMTIAVDWGRKATQKKKTAAKLTGLCNTLRTSNSFARSDTGVVKPESHVQNKPRCLLHWLSIKKKQVSMIREYHNHTLQLNPRYREEETQL